MSGLSQEGLLVRLNSLLRLQGAEIVKIKINVEVVG